MSVDLAKGSFGFAKRPLLSGIGLYKVCNFDYALDRAFLKAQYYGTLACKKVKDLSPLH